MSQQVTFVNFRHKILKQSRLLDKTKRNTALRISLCLLSHPEHDFRLWLIFSVQNNNLNRNQAFPTTK